MWTMPNNKGYIGECNRTPVDLENLCIKTNI